MAGFYFHGSVHHGQVTQENPGTDHAIAFDAHEIHVGSAEIEEIVQ